MTEAKLPEEIIHTILVLAIPRFCPKSFLRYPDHDGPRWTQERPGALRVSKRWHRIAIPLVYESVALSGSKHTSALARLVKANPGIGRAIRYLRLQPLNRDVLLKGIPKMHLAAKCTSTSSGACFRSRHKLKTQLEVAPALTNPVAPLSFEPGSMAATFCAPCRAAVQERYEKMRQETWDKVPEAFGFFGWDDIRRREDELYRAT